MSIKTKKIIKSDNDYIKAVRKADRELENEFATGFVAKHKTHKSIKNYNRKNKHKENYN